MRVLLPRNSPPPQVRALEPWRDGRQLAALIESAFTREEIGAGGARMVELLRSYGQYEPMTFGLGTSFVWIEGGCLVGNASIQRNPTRSNTWIIGNVATDPAHRRRGIARALIEACMNYAASRGARHIALLVDQENDAARRLYESQGFHMLGVTTYSMHEAGALKTAEPQHGAAIREARWSDRAAIWALTRANITEEYTFAEPFFAGLYRLGVVWSARNFFGGGREKWFVLENSRLNTRIDSPFREGKFERSGLRRDERTPLLGAVRVHAGQGELHHHVELMLGGAAVVEQGEMLLMHALRSLFGVASLPVAAAQSHTNAAAAAAIERVGFLSRRVLVHMKKDCR